MNKYYAGIGSRQTPNDILELMVWIGKELAKYEYILRSGGADGADSAFEHGCMDGCGEKEIFLPWKNFNKNRSSLYGVGPEAFKIAESLHPAYHKCSQGAQKLLARNCYQILGQNLKTPVDFVVCWTKHAKVVGGTALGIKLAYQYEIPVYNLCSEEERMKFWELLETIENKYLTSK